ncbi:hypothetical protein V1512DRAFT_255720 [Lipomyces arxii]|uniref:uncharacterized protein n=1 Tax=Lipomyces arxii TaxID=56418 RepID=UPI0034CD22C8
MESYNDLEKYLLGTSLSSPPDRDDLQPLIDNIRFALIPKFGALAVIWPGISQVLTYRSLAQSTIVSLVDDVIKPMCTAKVMTWIEVREVIGSAEALVGAVRSDTLAKVKEASLSFLSLYDFSEGQDDGVIVIQDTVSLLGIEKLQEGVVTALERALEQFLGANSAVRPVLIKAALDLKVANETSAVIISRIQDLMLKIIDSSGAQGVDDIPDQLLRYTVKQDDVLAELMTMQFYESLLDLYLPPLIFLKTRQEYFDIASIYQSSDSLGLEKSASARSLGRLSQARTELFAEIDHSLAIVKNLTVRDETDRKLLALIPGDYLAEHNSQLIRSFPVATATLLPILCNWCSSYDALGLLDLTTAKLTKLPVPELLQVGRALAMSPAGTKALATMPGVMEILLDRQGRSGYELMRLRGDIVDALAEDANYEILGEFWYTKVRNEQAIGHWGDGGEVKVDLMDSAA